MSHQRPGLFSRIRAAFGGALKCGILGKSMNRFSGNDEYWDRVIAAQLGWPQETAAANQMVHNLPVILEDKEQIIEFAHPAYCAPKD